jgi:predicted nucleic acid-binding protein
MMDNRHGTLEARKRGLEVVGALALLDRAAAGGWIDLQEMFRRLRASTFLSPLYPTWKLGQARTEDRSWFVSC